jgi:hypothetical protein
MSRRLFKAVLAAVIIFTAAWSAPYEVPFSEPLRIEATHTPIPTVPQRFFNTPNPYEIQTNSLMTNGILVVGVIIVLIIGAGTVIVLRRKL